MITRDMTTEAWSIRHWQQMFDRLTNPDEQQKARLANERKARADIKRADTGL